jgi:hypothetical protein
MISLSETPSDRPAQSSPVATETREKKSLDGRVRSWAARHVGEIAWALLFAVLAGYAFIRYTEDPKPFKIYVVADPDTDAVTLSRTFRSQEHNSPIGHIGRVPVDVQLEVLADRDKETANKKAEELVARPDTLLVVMHGRSDHVTHSLKTYLAKRPQVPIIATAATDDDLLSECDSSCVDQGWFETEPSDSEPFRPLLQLSPTNAAQAHSAVMFASHTYKRRRFLIVSSNDPSDASYTKKMIEAYHDEITAAHGELKGVRDMATLPSDADLRKLDPDCILYAGGNGEAQSLLSSLSSMNLKNMDLVVMLSDSVIDTRGRDSDLAVFGAPQLAVPAKEEHHPGGKVDAAGRERLVSISMPKLQFNFTDQNDATDYNSHNNAYAQDAFLIAQTLITDLNDRGGDIRFRVKSALHLIGVDDARRNLVDIMKQNARFHSSYRSSSPNRIYVFEGHKQYGGIFHVWRLKQPSRQPGSEMDDVDNWHIPRSFTAEDDSTIAEP